MSVNGPDNKFKFAVNLLLIKFKAFEAHLEGLIKSQSLIRNGRDGYRGKVGAQGEQGIDGEIGAQGDQGIQGEVGYQGAQGENGVRGPRGIQGEFGYQGVQGENGVRGLVGQQGEQGPVGRNGQQGPQGGNGKDGASVTDATLVDNVLFIFIDGIRKRVGKIKLPTFLDSGGGRGGEINDKSGSVPWHILNHEFIRIPTRREMAVHGQLLVEGRLFIEGTGRLRVEI